MPWFSGHKEKDPWEEDSTPVGDIETAHRIRDICGSAESSAKKLANLANRPNDKKKQFEIARYDAAKKRALGLAKHLSDELLRDAAVRQIVNLCMKADDVETAAILIGAVRSEKIKEEMLIEHPALR